MTPDELRDVLDAAGRQPVPPPSPDFVRGLEARLAATRVVHGDGGRRPPWRVIGAVAAAAAILVAVVALQPGEPEQTVVTDPTTTSSSTSTTTSTTIVTTTLPATTSTAVAVTTTTAAPPPTTTTSVPPTTTTTVVTTTTTAAPGVEDMRLSCVTGPRPEVTCTWSKNEHEQFKGYRLSKRVDDGPLVEVVATTDRAFTSKTDKDVQVGTRITYVIEAFDHDTQLIARGEVTVACC